MSHAAFIKVGASVEVFSNSQNVWKTPCTITEVNSDGSVRVEYEDGSGAKNIPCDFVDLRVRELDLTVQFERVSIQYGDAVSKLKSQRQTTVSILEEVKSGMDDQGDKNENTLLGQTVVYTASFGALVLGGPVTAAALGIGGAVGGYMRNSDDASEQQHLSSKLEGFLTNDKDAELNFTKRAKEFQKCCNRILEEHPDGKQLKTLTKGFLGRNVGVRGDSVVNAVSACSMINGIKDLLSSGGHATEAMMHTGQSQRLKDIFVGIGAMTDDVGSVGAAGSNVASKAATASPLFVALSGATAVYYTASYAFHDPKNTSAFHTKVNKMLTSYRQSLRELNQL